MPENRYFDPGMGERLLAQVFRRSETVWKYEADEVFRELFGRDWIEDRRDIVVSDEAIGRTASRHGLLKAHLAALKAATEERGISRIKLLCLVRRQDHWLASHYAQVSDRSENPGQSDFEHLIDKIADPRAERFTFGALLDYAAIEQAVSESLGPESLVLIPMEWMNVHEAAFQNAIAGFLEIEPDALAWDCTVRDNKRSTGHDRWQLRKAAGGIGRLIGKAGSKPEQIELKPELSRRILDIYRAPNLETERLRGLDLQELGYLP
ncbi:hypothetical protein [Novosphingobium marinum]|uniref:Sulfotransferase family protein n=1 Tax=Novosphingobium marinum TaxID=1514948 RepID=A0A7Z0BV82_9SPHN|nr:hypothetical protein [Novosphingobium marinum]NYH97024.1 hypothetical protein [Novosphingobium marinum]